MGDFVDRGFYSVETFLLLLAMKVSSTWSARRVDPFFVERKREGEVKES